MAAKNKLTVMQVKSLPAGKYADGMGLWFHRRKDGGGQWFLRVTIHGQRREMGLGSMDAVGLKEAREAANRWRAIARKGMDPIKERDRLRRKAAREDHSFATIARQTFETKKAELKGDGKAGRWFSPLELHVVPRIGRTPVEEIDQRDIKNALLPIWDSKGETARKALGRIRIVLRHAAAMGLDVDIQAADKARELLGKSRQKSKHVPALPWAEVPSFYETLSDGTTTHLALRLLILTAVRSANVRFLHLSEVEGDTWIIPSEKTKAGREHRVPLSNAAQNVIATAAETSRDGYLFPSVRRGVISDATMSRLMERRNLRARPHGFRSSFRTWCAEVTDVPREIAEMALAHSVGTKVELAYRRTDYLERRRALMDQWASFVTTNEPSGPPVSGANA
ncbi:tyrosine-type recombinase/integrase [Sulfitobacter sp. D7]|uniref:tyrosine-type recombinase/integrase n=1 Tax=Sulfitobacter sp. D7 TaxID=1968541 RepID=UPI000E777CDA|nr:site-specific integrase [Sulfitobacter sp. D7]AYE84841.1 integrase [Sulfitobacter sp. D7]